ncbi:MAG: hypothetical protein WBF58_11055 [Xanthobacteraceae bacterium]
MAPAPAVTPVTVRAAPGTDTGTTSVGVLTGGAGTLTASWTEGFVVTDDSAAAGAGLLTGGAVTLTATGAGLFVGAGGAGAIAATVGFAVLFATALFLAPAPAVTPVTVRAAPGTDTGTPSVGVLTGGAGTLTASWTEGFVVAGDSAAAGASLVAGGAVTLTTTGAGLFVGAGGCGTACDAVCAGGLGGAPMTLTGLVGAGGCGPVGASDDVAPVAGSDRAGDAIATAGTTGAARCSWDAGAAFSIFSIVAATGGLGCGGSAVSRRTGVIAGALVSMPPGCASLGRVGCGQYDSFRSAGNAGAPNVVSSTTSCSGAVSAVSRLSGS